MIWEKCNFVIIEVNIVICDMQLRYIKQKVSRVNLLGSQGKCIQMRDNAEMCISQLKLATKCTVFSI